MKVAVYVSKQLRNAHMISGYALISVLLVQDESRIDVAMLRVVGISISYVLRIPSLSNRPMSNGTDMPEK